MRSERASGYRGNADYDVMVNITVASSGWDIQLEQNRTECDTAQLEQKCRTVIQLAWKMNHKLTGTVSNNQANLNTVNVCN